ncbi:MAG: phosphoribosylformylglycinamidine synthase subunit PurQ [Roseofilum sp. SBFL]|uniref:phosphoribosylformylglycinamidine synthase subunit PurQ n=1 Tax=unclassified Roseofilum TaxID=2620099 RepID=UPI001B05DAA8|nr:MULTISPECIES: phosphoribosylformylglycinamidine synthase subunit PurQ [unclassified Roseofilum]MBP0012325.1 phosphoribosylformylglycinamidine synthase subunit PurQ [Roseofilum sp. SID3]MBP0023385.1 phosphoribosylformylglycinamidine synthase subunit PurQ [Roseofilum sp. SID2]MBP0039694.1 phosphoribosylformylglycinamidine synthase subunit PurQ [Roseofilum sp. SID1]MBP0043609.1 phosphoribosylformylglycinamidine synthase subunit PurQ [Roseofilum sp. SBFL]
MKFGVVVFPGSNCDRDMVYVLRDVLGCPTRLIWHQETTLDDVDVVVLPGGFSYGDYLRCGAIARFSPIMGAIVEHANQGKLVFGICNGFQVLTEVGLLPGALTRNQGLHFVCDRITLKVENNQTPFTHLYVKDRSVTLPIAHGEGHYYADSKTLNQLEENQQVLFRYVGENPNGSLNDIAGICNHNGNVMGMMPHPERASDRVLGGTDGLALFKGLLERMNS